MKKVRIVARNAFVWIKKRDNFLLTLFFLIIFAVLFINAFHESYPDEFDNILGGWDIRHGILIYRDFFTHHGPVAYFLSALITLFSGQSFVRFRVIFAILLFGYLAWSYWYLRVRFSAERVRFYLIFLALLAVAGNYYWLHMLLADTLSAYFLAPVIAILFLTSFYNKVLLRKDLIVISLLTSLTILCSLTFLYLSFLIYAYAFYLYMRPFKREEMLRSGLIALVIFAVPYGVYLLYLIVTFSLKDYLYDALTFNQRYYIYNYPRPSGVTTINPLRFAIVIAHNFYNSYYTLLQQVKDFNFGFPLNITFAVGTLGAVIYLLLRRYYLLGLFLIGALIYSNARSEPLTSRETDYQSAVYIAIAFLVIPFLLTRLYKELNEHSRLGRSVLQAGMLLIIGIYSLFSSLFLIQRFFNRSYDKYMGNAPLIYENPQVAPIINKIVTKDETVWIGPFAFQDLFYTNAKPASKYQIFIPGMGLATELHQPFINELEKTKPKVIYFQKNFYILGRSPETYGQFFIDYLSDKYVRLMDYEKDSIQYTSKVPINGMVDLDARLYLRKENADEMISRLLANDLIQVKNQ